MESLLQIDVRTKKLSKAKKLVVSGLTKVTTECSKTQEHPGSLDDSDGEEEVKGRPSRRSSRNKTSKLSVECRGSKLVSGKCNQTATTTTTTTKDDNSIQPAVKRFKAKKYEREYSCDLKGGTMSFSTSKDAGERPYRCAETGCGQTFRFVADFSRRKRKTGHSVKSS